MKKKLLILLLLLGVASSAWASNDWLTSAPSSDWFTATNWSLGHVPISSDMNNVRTYQTHMNTTYMPTINSGTATAYQLEVGGDNDAISPTKSRGKFTINGGTLTMTDYFRCGASSTSNRWGEIYINGASTVVNSGNLTVGWGSSTIDVRGWLYMTDGTVNVTNAFTIASALGASGWADLNGGIINAGSFAMNAVSGTHTGTASLDISGNAKVIINGNILSTVQGYIDNGWIKTDGVPWTDYAWVTYNAGTNKTILAIPEPATLCILAIGALSLIRRKR